MPPPVLVPITTEEAHHYLMQDRDRYLMQLGALRYDPVKALVGLVGDSGVVALAMHVEEAGALPDPRPTIMLAANHEAYLEALLAWPGRPEYCVIATSNPRFAERLELLLGTRRSLTRGLVYYGAEEAATLQPRVLHIPTLPGNFIIRRLTEEDALALDVTACGLSSTSLRGWLRLGWRVYGAIEGRVLVAHALAAYPIGDGDEVAALYTAGRARRRGIGSAVVAAVIGDIRSRGRRAFYVASRNNLPSRQLAERLGLCQLAETWDIVLG
jgi:GNAT superfamily N-acetyltransferase